MIALLILFKAWIAASLLVLIRCFCRGADIESIAIPGATVLALCAGVWGLN